MAWNWFTAPQTHKTSPMSLNGGSRAGEAVWPNINQRRINRNCYTLCGVGAISFLALFADEVGSCWFFLCGDTFACDWTREWQFPGASAHKHFHSLNLWSRPLFAVPSISLRQHRSQGWVEKLMKLVTVWDQWWFTGRTCSDGIKSGTFFADDIDRRKFN